MGTGKKTRCNNCGAEWIQLYGVGFNGKEIDEEKDKCPECGSKDIKNDPETTLLWD